MQYLICLKIKIEKFPNYFIEVIKQYELPFHPNLTDEICVDDYYCTIENIHVDISEGSHIISLINTGGGPHEDEEVNVIPRLKDEMKELEQYGWRMNDYDFGEGVEYES